MMNLKDRRLIDAVALGTLNLNPADDGMTDEDLEPNGKAIKRYLSVAKPLDPKKQLNSVTFMRPIEELSAMVLLFLVIGSVVYIPVLSILAITLLSWSNLLGLIVAVIFWTIVADYFIPDKRWPPYRFAPEIRLLLYKYFSFKLIFPEHTVFQKSDGDLISQPNHYSYSNWLFIRMFLTPTTKIPLLPPRFSPSIHFSRRATRGFPTWRYPWLLDLSSWPHQWPWCPSSTECPSLGQNPPFNGAGFV